MGSLFYAALGPVTCAKCGAIPRGEFSTRERRRLLLSSLAFLVPALALAVVALSLLVRSCGEA